MSNSRLLKLAEQLRSDCHAHRELASIKIQQSTGLTMTKIIEKGAKLRVPADRLNAILDNLYRFGDDELVQFVTETIADLSQVTWPDIVLAGSGMAPSQKSQTITWEDIINDDFWNIGKAAKSQPKPAAPKERRVLKDEMPIYATGVPHIEMTGTARNGSLYAKVTFNTFASNGETMKPMCSFMAFGEPWISELEKANKLELPISFMIQTAKNPNFDPIIRTLA